MTRQKAIYLFSESILLFSPKQLCHLGQKLAATKCFTNFIKGLLDSRQSLCSITIIFMILKFLCFLVLCFFVTLIAPFKFSYGPTMKFLLSTFKYILIKIAIWLVQCCYVPDKMRGILITIWESKLIEIFVS